jgi:hypothetical protein
VCGRLSSVCPGVCIVATESQMRSAEGSITEFISSFTLATGLNGGGALLQPTNRIALTGTHRRNVRIWFTFSAIPTRVESRVYGGSDRDVDRRRPRRTGAIRRLVCRLDSVQQT